MHVIDYWAQTEIVNCNLDRIYMPTKSVSVLMSQIKELVLTELDNEIECPRCHEVMELQSSFDRTDVLAYMIRLDFCARRFSEKCFNLRPIQKVHNCYINCQVYYRYEVSAQN